MGFTKPDFSDVLRTAALSRFGCRAAKGGDAARFACILQPYLLPYLKKR
jgi:hypothetical protein